uniref:Uncharacterized protein n=1 Tax=Solanum lycopersicum TaxID=4081 RepID=A0A494G8C8_SOLLC
MPSSPLSCTHGRTTSGMACHNRLWAAQTVEQRWARHAIIALGRQTLSNDVGRGMPSPPLDSTTWSNDVGHDIPLTPLDNTHGKMTLGLACHHRLWAAHTVKRRLTWHHITAFGQHTQSNDVGREACHHRLWTAHTVERRRAWHAIIAIGKHTRSNDVGFGMPSSPLGSTRSNDVGRGITSPPFESTHD